MCRNITELRGLRTGGDRRGDRGRRAAVRPQGQRRDPAVGSQRRCVRDRGRRGHRDDDAAAGLRCRRASSRPRPFRRCGARRCGPAWRTAGPGRQRGVTATGADPARAQGVERGGACDARRPPNRVAAQGRNSREEVHARLAALPVLPDGRAQPRRARAARAPRPAGAGGGRQHRDRDRVARRRRKSLPPWR